MRKCTTTRRLGCAAALTVVAALLVPRLASAQIRQVSSRSSSDANQTFNFTIGAFSPRSLDARANDDLWVTELPGTDTPLIFLVQDFRGAMVGGEYLLGLGRYVEAGVGVGYYQRTVPSVYANQVHQNGDDIAQDLKLRMIPVSFTARWFHSAAAAASNRTSAPASRRSGGVTPKRVNFSTTPRTSSRRTSSQTARRRGRPSSAAYAFRLAR